MALNKPITLHGHANGKNFACPFFSGHHNLSAEDTKHIYLFSLTLALMHPFMLFGALALCLLSIALPSSSPLPMLSALLPTLRGPTAPVKMPATPAFLSLALSD